MMQEKATGAKQQITARVSPDIREDIERRQRAGGRSVSDVVEAVYRAGMKAEAVGAQQRTAAPVIAHEVRELMIDAEQRIVGQVREAVGAAVASETMVLREDQLTLVSAASGGYVKRSSGFWGRMPPPLAPEAGG